MFARTERLLLRPGWAEDAPALTEAIGDEAIVRNLSAVPWPYGMAEAKAWLAGGHDPLLPSFLIMERTPGAPRLVGACSLSRRPSGAVELGYWIARRHWGRGFATEAGRALVEIVQTLKLPRLEAAHFVDNPASARVLEKLGFVPTGIAAERYSCARGTDALTRMASLDLGEGRAQLAA